jgi:hypothetical protein
VFQWVLKSAIGDFTKNVFFVFLTLWRKPTQMSIDNFMNNSCYSFDTWGKRLIEPFGAREKRLSISALPKSVFEEF